MLSRLACAVGSQSLDVNGFIRLSGRAGNSPSQHSLLQQNYPRRIYIPVRQIFSVFRLVQNNIGRCQQPTACNCQIHPMLGSYESLARKEASRVRMAFVMDDCEIDRADAALLTCAASAVALKYLIDLIFLQNFSASLNIEHLCPRKFQFTNIQSQRILPKI